MKYQLLVEGMMCEHCVKAVTDILVNEVDATDVYIELAEGRVTLSTTAQVQDIKNCIEGQGYDVTQIDPITN